MLLSWLLTISLKKCLLHLNSKTCADLMRSGQWWSSVRGHIVFSACTLCTEYVGKLFLLYCIIGSFRSTYTMTQSKREMQREKEWWEERGGKFIYCTVSWILSSQNIPQHRMRERERVRYAENEREREVQMCQPVVSTLLSHLQRHDTLKISPL